MPDQESESNAGAPEPSSGSSPERSSSRRKPLTPELRKFLGPGRSWHDREAAKEAAESADAAAEEERVLDTGHVASEPEESSPNQAAETAAKAERSRTPPSSPTVVPDHKSSRVHEMQTVALVVGALILLGAAFYGGTKARHIKAFLASRNKPEITNVDNQKFPGLTADELVEQALAAERLGQWREAVERLLVAKRRNYSYRGLVFHAAKLCYDHGDFDGADLLLERAIVFGDEIDTANYLRGLIASGRNDLAAAEQFFQAAIAAEPFTPGYYYYLAETLRKQHRSNDAIVRYEQAASRTVNEQDAMLCRFKARMAKAESPDRAQLQAEVDEKKNTGAATLDWLLTGAALKIRSGEFAEAAELIRQARSSEQASLPTVLGSYMGDMLFTDAASKHPEIAEACRLDTRTPAATPSPFANP